MADSSYIGFQGMTQSREGPSTKQLWVGKTVSYLSGLSRFGSELLAVHKMAGPWISALFAYRTAVNVRRVASEGALACVDSSMSGRSYRIRCLGATLEIDGNWFGGAREIYGHQTYFAPANHSIGGGQTVVDLGANVGLFSLLAARLGARVVAVEAQSGFLPIFRQNLQRNNCSADLIHGVIGPETGVAAVRGALEAGSHYLAKPVVVSLNQITADFRLANIDFLKIDIEGSEFDLFSKDVEWLDRTSRIAMEVHESFGDPNAIVETLEIAGLHVRLCDSRLKSVSALKGQNGFLYAWR